MHTNNVTRLLDSRKIKYEVFNLPGGKLAAEQVARLMNAAPEIVFKSIVITRRGQPVARIVPEPVQRELTPEQVEARERTRHRMAAGYSLGGRRIDRDTLHER